MTARKDGHLREGMNKENIKEVAPLIEGIIKFAIDDMRRNGYSEELIHKVINNNPIGDYLRKKKLEKEKEKGKV
jgi:hypothetical protein